MSEPILVPLRTSLEEFKSIVYSDVQGYVHKEAHVEFQQDGYSIPIDIRYDARILSELRHRVDDNIAVQDLENSKIVGESLGSLTPELANEEGIWVHLSHTSCWEYCRERWLRESALDNLKNAISLHIFASTREKIRDHQAIARLWWSWYIARISWPENPERALELILTSADTRQNFVKRIWLCSRKNIASAVLRAMDAHSWITEKYNIRSFMKMLNRYGGGIVFEALTEEECDDFVERCVHRIKKDQ